MNIRINYRIILVCILSIVSIRMSAIIDFVSVDPLWEAAVMTGTKKVMDQYNTQNTKLLEMAALQNTMALHFNAVKEWRRKENAYLKVACYAEAVQAGSRLTAEAVRTVRDLMDLKKVMQRNPEGIAATVSMNNLYIETIVEFIKTFRMLQNVLIGEESDDESNVPMPVAEPVISPGCVIVSITINNSTKKDIAFDGKICFIFYGTLADGSYTGYFRQKGICSGGDYTIPAGGSKTYTVVFEDDGQDPEKVLGMPFAESNQTGSFDSNNCIYIGGSGYTCKNQSSGSTFQRGGSYSMTVEGDSHEWTSGGGEGNSMLTGKERVEMIWSLCDRLEEMNAKVRKLILSVAYYRVKDIWAFYTRGMFDRDKGEIAVNCLERWNRVQDAVKILN